MRAQKKAVRKKSFETVSRFIDHNESLDIVIACPSMGKAIFWNVPYDAAIVDEETLELSVDWGRAEKQELLNGDILLAELPTMPFSTKYTLFLKADSSLLGPLYFNTGGGYREMIYFSAFGHSIDSCHIYEVKRLAEEEPRYHE